MTTSTPSPINLTAAAKLWAIDFLRRLATELEHADRTALAEAPLRLRLQELATDAARIFPSLEELAASRGR